jgi:hypothetical protein
MSGHADSAEYNAFHAYRYACDDSAEYNGVSLAFPSGLPDLVQ